MLCAGALALRMTVETVDETLAKYASVIETQERNLMAHILHAERCAAPAAVAVATKKKKTKTTTPHKRAKKMTADAATAVVVSPYVLPYLVRRNREPWTFEDGMAVVDNIRRDNDNTTRQRRGASVDAAPEKTRRARPRYINMALGGLDAAAATQSTYRMALSNLETGNVFCSALTYRMENKNNRDPILRINIDCVDPTLFGRSEQAKLCIHIYDGPRIVATINFIMRWYKLKRHQQPQKKQQQLQKPQRQQHKQQKLLTSGFLFPSVQPMQPPPVVVMPTTIVVM